MKRTRPVHLNLLVIRQPFPALISIFHRVSGALLFLGIPVLLQTLQMVVTNSTERLAHAGFRFALFVVLGAYSFHFLAGLRFLLLDVHWGVERQSARRSALVVGVAAVMCILFLGVSLW